MIQKDLLRSGPADLRELVGTAHDFLVNLHVVF